MDFILNGQANGNVASVLMNNNMDVNALRPYIGKDGCSYRTIMVNGKYKAVPTTNDATLRKDEWKLLDTAIIKAAKPRLKLVADLRGAGLTYNIPNGMGKTVLETENQSDVTDAIISMDGLRESANDRPVYDLTNLPLPIIHKDFSYSLRQVMTSRNGGSPLDTTMAELSARKVAETAEKLAAGTYGTYAFGGGTIYGLINYPNRLTRTMTSPLAGGWTPATTIAELLAMRLQSQNAYHYGPFMLYVSTPWDTYLDTDYSTAKGDNTLRDRIKRIEGISDVRTLDYLPNDAFHMILVQMTSDVVREVIGMDITTLQWETKGGMQLNYKVMAILVPQIRCDQNLRTGIVHGTTL